MSSSRLQVFVRTGDPCGFNKGHSSTFCVGSRVQQTPEETWRTYRSKHCGNNNKDEDNNPKTLNDKKKFDTYIRKYVIRRKYFIVSKY